MQTHQPTDALPTIARSELPAVAGGTLYACPKPPVHPALPRLPAPPVGPHPAPCFPDYRFGRYVDRGFSPRGFGYRSGDYGFPGFEFR